MDRSAVFGIMALCVVRGRCRVLLVVLFCVGMFVEGADTADAAVTGVSPEPRVLEAQHLGISATLSTSDAVICPICVQDIEGLREADLSGSSADAASQVVVPLFRRRRNNMRRGSQEGHVATDEGEGALRGRMGRFEGRLAGLSELGRRAFSGRLSAKKGPDETTPPSELIRPDHLPVRLPCHPTHVFHQGCLDRLFDHGEKEARAQQQQQRQPRALSPYSGNRGAESALPWEELHGHTSNIQYIQCPVCRAEIDPASGEAVVPSRFSRRSVAAAARAARRTLRDWRLGRALGERMEQAVDRVLARIQDSMQARPRSSLDSLLFTEPPSQAALFFLVFLGSLLPHVILWALGVGPEDHVREDGGRGTHSWDAQTLTAGMRSYDSFHSWDAFATEYVGGESSRGPLG